MADLETLLDFPCDYTIKVLGAASDDLVRLVESVVARHAPEGIGETRVNPSRKGRFIAVNLTFRVTSAHQLYAIHEELNRSPLVRLIL